MTPSERRRASIVLNPFKIRGALAFRDALGLANQPHHGLVIAACGSGLCLKLLAASGATRSVARRRGAAVARPAPGRRRGGLLIALNALAPRAKGIQTDNRHQLEAVRFAARLAELRVKCFYSGAQRPMAFAVSCTTFHASSTFSMAPSTFPVTSSRTQKMSSSSLDTFESAVMMRLIREAQSIAKSERSPDFERVEDDACASPFGRCQASLSPRI